MQNQIILREWITVFVVAVVVATAAVIISYGSSIYLVNCYSIGDRAPDTG